MKIVDNPVAVDADENLTNMLLKKIGQELA